MLQGYFRVDSRRSSLREPLTTKVTKEKLKVRPSRHLVSLVFRGPCKCIVKLTHCLTGGWRALEQAPLL
jgi:hypothetical protein